MSDEIKNKLNCDYDIISTINHNPVKYLYNSYKLNNTDFKNTNINNKINRSRNLLCHTFNQNQEGNFSINIQSNTAPIKNLNNNYLSEKSQDNSIVYSKAFNQDECEENQFNEFLKDLMLAEGQIEKIKIELSQYEDFNIEDFFCFFKQSQEINNDNELFPKEIQLGFKLLGVFLSNFEIKLFFNRFDLLKNGFLNYSNFFDIFAPFTEKYRVLLEKKEPNQCYNCHCPLFFSNKTSSLLKNLLDNIIKYENKFNFMRRSFTTLNIKLKKLFEKIDTGKNGYFSNDDLVIYMKKNRIFTSNKDIDLLFIRLDKNRNGKIDYKEIYDETHPIYY